MDISKDIDARTDVYVEMEMLTFTIRLMTVARTEQREGLTGFEMRSNRFDARETKMSVDDGHRATGQRAGLDGDAAVSAGPLDDLERPSQIELTGTSLFASASVVSRSTPV